MRNNLKEVNWGNVNDYNIEEGWYFLKCAHAHQDKQSRSNLDDKSSQKGNQWQSQGLQIISKDQKQLSQSKI